MMSEPATAVRVPPVRRQIVVPVAPAVAFDVFTSEIGLWWPLDTGLSVHGAGGTVRFVNGKLVEEAAGGTAVWGSVVDWAPPELLRLTWHPGRDATDHTDLCIRFAAVGDGDQTLVTLEHTGWERLADPLGNRTEYAGGWVAVLERYEQRATGVTATIGDGAPSPVWLALCHTVGVNGPADGNVFAHADFGEHFAFLMRLRERGVLVAAGPIAGTAGEGMTIVTVPAGELAGYVREAHEEDLSVARGLLQVEVKAWQVQVTG